MVGCWQSINSHTSILQPWSMFSGKKFYKGFVHLKKKYDAVKVKKRHLLSLRRSIFQSLFVFLSYCQETKSGFSSTFERQKCFFEMYNGLVKDFATKQRPWLQNERVRINVPPTPNHQNVILAFFGNICVSLLNNSVN